MSDHSLRLLLIEDDVVDCEVVRRLLRGFAILSETQTGIEGVEALSTTKPDCVLLSTRPPDTDLFEILERIAADERGTPAVLLAQAGDDEIVEAGLAAGALGWVSKSSLEPWSLRQAILLALRTASARRELAAARREIEYVTGNLVRELRTPLRQIAELGNGLHARHAARLDDAAMQDLARMRDTALRMAAFVGDLAEYSAAGGAEANKTWVDLNDVMRRAVERLDGAVQRTGTQIEVEPLPTVWGDLSALGRLFENLIVNSMTTHGRGTPVLRVSSRLTDGDWEIWVQDNGPGFDPGKLSGVFRPELGQPGPPGARRLGLATCARIVERHGGRIRLLSRPGHGSIFRFTLAAPPAPAPSLTVPGGSV